MEKQYPQKKIEQLLEQWANNTISDQDMKVLHDWYRDFPDSVEVDEVQDDATLYADLRRDLQSRLGLEVKRQRNSGLIRIVKFVSATAAVITFCFFGLHFLKKRNKAEDNLVNLTIPVDVSAGKDAAILTLTDGTKIDLNKEKLGEIKTTNSNIQLTKTKQGTLQYRVIGKNGGTVKNTMKIETPAGGQYEIILPDASIVFLNAKSSLTFPTVFTDGFRDVVLTGEGYFTVSKDRSKPFHVTARNQRIEVLGTKFNVNSYFDEPFVTTTLEEGSVRVSVEGNEKLLKPGYQAITENNKLQIRQANLHEALGWKNDEFVFVDADLRTIMRQLSRWYNVDVEYIDDPQLKPVTGRLNRNTSLNTAMKVLNSSSNIKFKVELVNGRTKLIIK